MKEALPSPAPTETVELFAVRDTEREQDSDFRRISINSNSYSDVLNQALDKLTMQIQELANGLLKLSLDDLVIQPGESKPKEIERLPSLKGNEGRALKVNEGANGIDFKEFPPEQVNADWDEDNPDSKAYIENKPTIPSPYTLPTATDAIKGGVRIGSGLTMTEEVLSATGGDGGAIVDNGATIYNPNKARVIDLESVNAIGGGKQQLIAKWNSSDEMPLDYGQSALFLDGYTNARAELSSSVRLDPRQISCKINTYCNDVTNSPNIDIIGAYKNNDTKITLESKISTNTAEEQSYINLRALAKCENISNLYNNEALISLSSRASAPSILLTTSGSGKVCRLIMSEDKVVIGKTGSGGPTNEVATVYTAPTIINFLDVKVGDDLTGAILNVRENTIDVQIGSNDYIKYGTPSKKFSGNYSSLRCDGKDIAIINNGRWEKPSRQIVVGDGLVGLVDFSRITEEQLPAFKLFYFEIARPQTIDIEWLYKMLREIM